jgi:hypothetical protein
MQEALQRHGVALEKKSGNAAVLELPDSIWWAAKDSNTLASPCSLHSSGLGLAGQEWAPVIGY